MKAAIWSGCDTLVLSKVREFQLADLVKAQQHFSIFTTAFMTVEQCEAQLKHLTSLLSYRGLQPLDLQQLRFAKGDLYFVLVNPKFEAPTAEMRAVLPKMVPMTAAIHNSSMGGSLVS